ncbi:MAG: succinate dehydrogenase/fumarate reductase iron-sulfur subunit [Candidatus Thioglobus sp.]|nr:MAG: succinate dehydrogenase/fumarate reductase iron-sulfur subunit [Candidatus Thioglobus sp.]KAA0446547.1 MAG: succinate dehydrogenase/fumarate reductase iron-sulfur subunit [Candidatus Thioglobus sp.]
MNFTLHIWRQKNQRSNGDFKTYELENVSSDSSFLEMLDQLNEKLLIQGEDCIVFDYDCREGICGACSLVINGYPHGKQQRTTTCQLYMREYTDETELWIEPWRADAFPVLKDLTVDRSAFDKIIQSGGFVSVHTGSAADANTVLINKDCADDAFNSATCIGCGACVAACPNTSASLFVAAKINHLLQLPQGKIESKTRAQKMSKAMFNEGFGVCSNHRHCEAECPKSISVSNITQMNKLIGWS